LAMSLVTIPKSTRALVKPGCVGIVDPPIKQL
jgi:hypothetical protein